MMRRLAFRGFVAGVDVARQFGINLRPDGRHILVACFPKSGSTFLAALLSKVTGFNNAQFVGVWGSNEQNLDPRVVETYRFKNTVVQQHAKGTEHNLELIDRYKMNVVVLTRNLADVVISIHDHIEQEDNKSPTGYFHPEYFSMNRSDKLTFIIRMILPWYFHFLISWRDAAQAHPCLWLGYEELFPDTGVAVNRILEFCGIKAVSEGHLASCIGSISGASTRLNVGRKGRGEELKQSQKEAMRDLGRCWKVSPEIMQLVGLDV